MILYAKINSNRSRQFRIVTTIEVANKKKIVRKKALGTEAQRYIEHLGHCYDMMKGKLRDGQFLLADSKTEGASFVSEFLPFPSLDTTFRHFIAQGDIEHAHDLLDRVIDYIQRFAQKTSFTDSEKTSYQTIFGNVFTDSTHLVDFGYLDYNLDNILEDTEDKLYLIDYEWVFDFPIPRELVIGRFLYHTFSRLDLGEDSTFDTITLDTYDLTLPKKSYAKYKKYLEHVPDLMKADSMFQRYVGSTTFAVDNASPQEQKYDGSSSLEKKIRIYRDRTLELERGLRKEGDTNSKLHDVNKELSEKMAHMEKKIEHLEERLPRVIYRKFKNFFARLFA